MSDKAPSKDAVERTARAYREEVKRRGGDISHEQARRRVTTGVERFNRRTGRG